MNKLIALILVLILELHSRGIEIKDAFIQQTPPNASNSAIFLTIVNNTDEDISLVDVKTNINEVTQLHTHIHKEGMMAMMPVSKISIKAHSHTQLTPSSYHIMLLKLNGPIDANTKANITLFFDNNQSLELHNVRSKEL